MSAGVELRLGSADASDRELADTAEELRQALESLAGVEEVGPLASAMQPGAKSGLVAAIGALLLKLAPGTAEQAASVIKSVLSRPGQPQTEISVGKDGSVSAKFDPRTTPLAEITAALRSLQAAQKA